MRIRKARAEDAAAMLAIKDQLPMPLADEATGSGGFLLGTDEATYRLFIEHAHCNVAEINGAVAGFAIVLPDAILKSSEVWQKRHEAKWEVPLADYEAQRLCYFEQFAFLPGHKRAVVALAYLAVEQAFGAGCTTLFAATVARPVLNLAAVPFIRAAGGQRAANIDEHYPVVGRINSDIWLVEKDAFLRHSRAHPLAGFFRRQSFYR